MSTCKSRSYSRCAGAACGVVQAHHIYALVDIRLPATFYIGISVHPYRRLQDHVSHVRYRVAHDYPLTCKQRVIASLLEDDLLPVMALLDSIMTDCHIEAKKREAEVTKQAIREGLPIVGVVCRNSVRILTHKASCISVVKKQKRRISDTT